MATKKNNARETAVTEVTTDGANDTATAGQKKIKQAGKKAKGTELTVTGAMQNVEIVPETLVVNNVAANTEDIILKEKKKKATSAKKEALAVAAPIEEVVTPTEVITPTEVVTPIEIVVPTEIVKKKTISKKKAVEPVAEAPIAAENKKAPAKKTASPVIEAAAVAVEQPVKPAPKKAKKAAVVEAPVAAVEINTAKITFQIRFHTKFGQALFITGNHELLGNNDVAKALPMQYLNQEFWTVTLKLDKSTIPAGGITYNYFIRFEDGVVSFDWGKDKVLTAAGLTTPDVFILDAWNFAGYFENAFYTEPFKQVLLKQNYTPVNASQRQTVTHILKVKAPLLTKGQALAVSGSVSELGNWGSEKFVLLSKAEQDDFYTVKLDLTKSAFPVIYKYLVYNIEEQKVVRFEGGSNRALYNGVAPSRQTIINDGFAVLPDNTWKGAGVAVPVFSLRSSNSAGVGEFADIKLLVDWAKKTGLRLVQILPVNDTTATHTWTDSYPYAAISAFALHPMYLRLEDLINDNNKHLLDGVKDEKARLNSLASVDYEAVNKLKWNIIRQVYPLQKDALFASEGYKQFLAQNSHWLLPYAAFCYLRDKYNTADFNAWPLHKTFVPAEIDTLLDEASPVYNEIAIHFFIQYHLHLQLKAATQYAHENGVIVKGDIPIGVYRYGADAWQNPELYHIDMQAGAPPDDFAVTGQNWGFPTYNWDKMKQDGFAWWKQRLEQMSHYFDAFRIDHILGFFRIWSIPASQVEGIMGHFEPAIPVYKNEFNEKGIWFDYDRYCKPYITDKILNDFFGDQQNHVRYHFLNDIGGGNYQLKPEYATQKQLETYFSWQQDNLHNRWLKQTLFNLISNVILFEAEGSNGQQFHFRFGMEGTTSFKSLEGGTQNQLRQLYVNYYFRRQDGFWMQQALQTLPALKRVTNMLVCGEDLGLVPACVPDVMKQLGLLSLEIQRMPKDSKKEFFHPADAPYLSVVTPSTHDMSTIRGWWEEDRNKTQKFYNNELGHWGTAPFLCEAWVNKLIVVQHLNGPSMWSIFQLQDLLGINKEIRRDDPNEERINVPAIPKYYWRYRMHLTLEQLIEANSFNEELLKSVQASGRGQVQVRFVI